MEFNEDYIKALKRINDEEINKYLERIKTLDNDEFIEFMEILYDKANELLGENYKKTEQSLLLEEIADFINDSIK